ncbi:MAG: hypothetical protein AAF968_06000 [Pseudomonadota bacterium]
MAVIRWDARPRGPRHSHDRQARLLATRRRFASKAAALHTVLFETLPDDVLEREVTVKVLFRSSRVLNLVLGGEPGMTFSARCHLSSTRQGRGLSRLSWAAAAGVIDLGCFVLRGERGHCAMAWYNHRARLNGEPVGDAAYSTVAPAPVAEALRA